MLKLGISTCPNDTFIYQNLIEGKVQTPCPISVEYADVQTLNDSVLRGALDMAKISAAVFPLVKDKYTLLKSGGAMGYGCGPLLLSSKQNSFCESEVVHLPGKNTTAAALFDFWAKNNGYVPKNNYMRFNELYNNLCSKHITQGVVIHEHRFTWAQNNLFLIADLGAFWESKLNVPIPLGCTVIKKELGESFAMEMEVALQKSLNLALERKQKVTDFIRDLAQIGDDEIIISHIDMFVNDFSMDIGEKGRKAMEILFGYLCKEN